MPDTISNIDWFGGASAALSQTSYWIGILLVCALILGAFAFVLYYTGFTYKVTVFPLYGSGKDGVFSFGKPRNNRFKWVNNKTAWKKLFPLANKEEIEPFDSEYIYQGNQMYAFELNGKLFPGRVNIKQTEDEIRGEINPVPYHIRNWESISYKKNAMEYAKHDFWTDNKVLVIGMIVAGLCLAACVATIWFTYQYSQAALGDIDTSALADAVNGLKNIAGKTPG